jgi:hypothetical protein
MVVFQKTSKRAKPIDRDHQEGCPHRVARAPAEADQGACERAGPVRGRHDAEDGGGVVGLLGDCRAEHEQRRVSQRHGEREHDHGDPEPRSRAHLVEALRELR